MRLPRRDAPRNDSERALKAPKIKNFTHISPVYGVIMTKQVYSNGNNPKKERL